MCESTLNRGRLARTELLIYVDKSVGSILCLILLEDSLLQTVVNAEKLVYFLIGADSECSDESCDRDFSVLVDADVNDVVGVHFVLKPRTTVRNNCCAEQVLTCLILLESVVNAGRTYKL